jgi:hypothetical protein
MSGGQAQFRSFTMIIFAFNVTHKFLECLEHVYAEKDKLIQLEHSKTCVKSDYAVLSFIVREYLKY